MTDPLEFYQEWIGEDFFNLFFINNERIYGLMLLIEKLSDDKRYSSSNLNLFHAQMRERSDSVVECLTGDRGVLISPASLRYVLEQDTLIIA